MGNILVVENTGFCNEGCELTTSWPLSTIVLILVLILFVLVLILFVLPIRIHCVCRRKQRQQNINEPALSRCENRIANLSEVIPMTRILCIDSVDYRRKQRRQNINEPALSRCENRIANLSEVILVIRVFCIGSVDYRRKQRRQNINEPALSRCENRIANLSEVILVIRILCIGSVDYGRKQRRQNINEPALSRCENRIANLSEVISVARTPCIDSVDIYADPIVNINQLIDQIIPSIEEQKLICYCDGSYSHDVRIGYAGFRASNGAYRIRFFSPREPKYGSTDTEVLAACLAIQHALENQYQKLTIYTDNSKVEQLFKRPKKKDNIQYPHFCQILNQYQKQNGDNIIEVIRVRGHTTISEQRTCKIKREFAKIDRTVRRKRRQYVKRYWIQFEQNYYHWYKPVYYSYGTYYYYWYKPTYYSYGTWRVLVYYS